MIKDDAVPVELKKTRFGGLPAVPEGEDFTWPVCEQCRDAMGFIGQLRVTAPPALLSLFIRQQGCTTSDPADGGSAALVLPTEKKVCSLRPLCLCGSSSGSLETVSEETVSELTARAQGAQGGRRKPGIFRLPCVPCALAVLFALVLGQSLKRAVRGLGKRRWRQGGASGSLGEPSGRVVRASGECGGTLGGGSSGPPASVGEAIRRVVGASGECGGSDPEGRGGLGECRGRLDDGRRRRRERVRAHVPCPSRSPQPPHHPRNCFPSLPPARRVALP